MDIKDAQSAAIGLLKTLITIPSYSREEKELADYLQVYIESLGYSTGRVENNIWIIAFEKFFGGKVLRGNYRRKYYA